MDPQIRYKRGRKGNILSMNRCRVLRSVQRPSPVGFWRRVVLWTVLLSVAPPLGRAVMCPAAESDWTRETVCEQVKTQLYVRNSPQLVTTSKGRLHVVYVQESKNQDELYLASSSPRGLQVEQITVIPHSEQPLTGVQSLALTVDARERPWLFLYTRDIQPEGPIFAELMASRTGSRVPWEVTTIRRSVNRDGGAGLSYPHLVVDRQQQFHVFSYVHNGFGEIHRVRHRHSQGNNYFIESLPRPPEKTDSGEVAIALDPPDRIHIAYSSTKALLGGRPEPGYPLASLTYTSWRDGQYMPPEIICPTVTEPGHETRGTVLSIGLHARNRNELDIVYLAGMPAPGETLRLEYVRGKLARTNDWQRELIQSTPPLTTTTSPTVSTPFVDNKGQIHFATSRDERTFYWVYDGTQWSEDSIPGEMHGFALLNRQTPVILTQQDRELILWRK